MQKAVDYDFFEGAEKRIAIVTDSNIKNISTKKWTELINYIGCNVLSVIYNEAYTFFLLAESSFLIGNNFVMLKTCGKTQPLLLLDVMNNNKILISSFTYSHPDFLRPSEQPYPYDLMVNEKTVLNDHANDFNMQDCTYSKNGKWSIYKFKNENKFNGNFYEMVCWNFLLEESIYKDICGILNNDFPNAIIDDKQFEPCGYSLNMLDSLNYVTIHITPQQSCSYMSVESNSVKINNLFTFLINTLDLDDFEIHTYDEDIKQTIILS